MLQQLGDLPTARDLYVQTAAIDRAAHGPIHHEVAADIWDLRLLLINLEGQEARLKMIVASHDILVQTLGPAHPRTIQVRSLLERQGIELPA